MTPRWIRIDKACAMLLTHFIKKAKTINRVYILAGFEALGDENTYGSQIKIPFYLLNCWYERSAKTNHEPRTAKKVPKTEWKQMHDAYYYITLWHNVVIQQRTTNNYPSICL